MYIYTFLCENCGYTADVAGGVGHTRLAFVETMLCADCRIVTDVRHIHSISQFHEAAIGSCSNCKGANLSKWTEPYACPKCDQTMNKTDAVYAC